jgi:hypothetical protein
MKPFRPLRRIVPRGSIFLFLFFRNYAYLRPSRLDERDVRVVTDVEAESDGRRWYRWTSDAVADGEDVWFWRPDAGAKFAMMLRHHADDGGKKARSPGRARHKR